MTCELYTPCIIQRNSAGKIIRMEPLRFIALKDLPLNFRGRAQQWKS